MTPDEFLAHYGVKGMKWGVKKARTGDLGTRAARAKRYASGASKQAGGTRRVIDTASALKNYGVNDLVKGRGLHKAAERHAKVYEAERKRLAKGEATAKDLIKAYGQITIEGLSTYGAYSVAKAAMTTVDATKKKDNNRKA